MMFLKVYASGGGRGRTGGGGGGTVNTPAGGGNGPVRIRGTFGRSDDPRRRVRGTTQGNANPNRQGMNPARYGPML